MDSMCGSKAKAGEHVGHANRPTTLNPAAERAGPQPPGRASLSGCVRRKRGMETPIFFSAAPSLANVLTMASGWKHARAARSMPIISASFSWDLRAGAPSALHACLPHARQQLLCLQTAHNVFVGLHLLICRDAQGHIEC